MPTPAGRTLITMPTLPLAAAGLEFQNVPRAGVNQNPYNRSVQVYDWNDAHVKASYSLPAMKKAQGQLWAAFILSAKGPVACFTFPSALCALFPEECTSDGTSPRYWELEGDPKWTIEKGPFYRLTFECRSL